MRAFFEEGGRRLFVQRVFNAPRGTGFDIDNGIPAHHYAIADTLTASLAPALLTSAANGLAGAIGAAGQLLIPAAAEAQAAVDAAQASVDEVAAAGAPPAVQDPADTAAAAALAAAQAAQTAIADTDAAIAALDGAADVMAAIAAAQTAIDDAVQAAADSVTAATAAQPIIAAIGADDLDDLAAETVDAAGEVVDALVGLSAHHPSLAARAAAASVLTDLAAETDITVAQVTETDNQLATARANLTAAQVNLAAAQVAADANPADQAAAAALGAAFSAVDVAQDVVDSAAEAAMAANTALQFEAIQPDAGDEPLRIIARFPGATGNMRANFSLRVGNNVYQALPAEPNPGMNRVRNGTLVHVRSRANGTEPWELPVGSDPDGLMVANHDRAANLWTLNGRDAAGAAAAIVLDGAFRAALGAAQFEVRPVTVIVSVERPSVEVNQFEREETLGEFGFEPERRTSLLRTFTANPENRNDALTTPIAIVVPDQILDPQAVDVARTLMAAGGLPQLLGTRATVKVQYTLANGDDGGYAHRPDLYRRSGLRRSDR